MPRTESCAERRVARGVPLCLPAKHVVSSGRGHIFSRGGRAPRPLPVCSALSRAAALFRQPTPLNSCFQLGYSLLKFAKYLLTACFQPAYSLLPASLQLASSQLTVWLHLLPKQLQSLLKLADATLNVASFEVCGEWRLLTLTNSAKDNKLVTRK